MTAPQNRTGSELVASTENQAARSGSARIHDATGVVLPQPAPAVTRVSRPGAEIARSRSRRRGRADVGGASCHRDDPQQPRALPRGARPRRPGARRAGTGGDRQPDPAGGRTTPTCSPSMPTSRCVGRRPRIGGAGRALRRDRVAIRPHRKGRHQRARRLTAADTPRSATSNDPACTGRPGMSLRLPRITEPDAGLVRHREPVATRCASGRSSDGSDPVLVTRITRRRRFAAVEWPQRRRCPDRRPWPYSTPRRRPAAGGRGPVHARGSGPASCRWRGRCRDR